MTQLLRIGCCGLARLSLKNYSEKFDLVEIQSIFYRLPRLETAQRWRQAVPRTFEFTLKAFQGITHPADSPTWRRNARALRNVKPQEVGLLRLTDFTRRSWNETIEVAEALEARVVVVQMPPSFEYNEANLQRISDFFGTVEAGVTPAIEFRHKNWTDKLEQVRDLMRKCNGIVVTDPLKMKVPNQVVQYHRLHGIDGFTNYRHRYSDGELKQLMRELGSMKTYVLFNNFAMREDAERFSKLCGSARHRVRDVNSFGNSAASNAYCSAKQVPWRLMPEFACARYPARRYLGDMTHSSLLKSEQVSCSNVGAVGPVLRYRSELLQIMFREAEYGSNLE